jgi:hypothetical protein
MPEGALTDSASRDKVPEYCRRPIGQTCYCAYPQKTMRVRTVSLNNLIRHPVRTEPPIVK